MKASVSKKTLGNPSKKRVCFVATLEMSIVAFLKDHMSLLQEHFDLTVITNTQDPGFLTPYGIRARVVPVRIERHIAPLHDIEALFRLWGIFRRERFDIVHSIMPKSGLLAMMAGFFARVPIRIHTFTGQFWKDMAGPARCVLKNIDRLLVFCSTHILVDSPSQRQFLITEGIVTSRRSRVIGNGSMCGVDIEKFAFNEKVRAGIRHDLGIPPGDIVYLFLGRMNKDKGVVELAQAFAALARDFGNARLLLVGPDEQGMKENINDICSHCPDRVHILGYVNNPQDYLSAADVCCLPSYREGFGLVIIEAGAAGLPSIGSRIYGIADTIEDGITGYMIEPGSYDDLLHKMLHFARDPSLAKIMGDKARRRSISMFAKNDITGAMLEFYENLRPGHET